MCVYTWVIWEWEELLTFRGLNGNRKINVSSVYSLTNTNNNKTINNENECCVHKNNKMYVEFFSDSVTYDEFNIQSRLCRWWISVFVCVCVCVCERERERERERRKYGECLNKKNYYGKRHIAINPPQNTPPCFKHTYPIVLATFWSISGSPLSWVSLVALLWLPRCPELIQNIYLSWSFWLWGKARSRTVE